MSQRQPATTLFVLPASQSPQALVIRRGPSKRWHFLLWDRDSDAIQHGSWFTGVVYPERCDLSPRADWMVMLGYRGDNTPRAWTALCKPPFVSAVVFWPLDHAKIGGGFFDGRLQVLWLNFQEKVSTPEIRGKQTWEFGCWEGERAPTNWYGSVEERLLRDGWKPQRGTGPKRGLVEEWVKSAPAPLKGTNLRLRLQGSLAEFVADPVLFFDARRVVYTLEVSEKPSREVVGVSWAGFNKKGDLCFEREGRLYRQPLDADGPVLILDATLLEFPPMTTPTEAPAE